VTSLPTRLFSEFGKIEKSLSEERELNSYFSDVSFRWGKMNGTQTEFALA